MRPDPHYGAHIATVGVTAFAGGHGVGRVCKPTSLLAHGAVQSRHAMLDEMFAFSAPVKYGIAGCLGVGTDAANVITSQLIALNEVSGSCACVRSACYVCTRA